MEVVIIRPVLVYGPGVKGNMARLIKLVKTEWPLPFGSVDNKRSMIGINNLVDLITVCCDHPGARNKIFLASDGIDKSLSQLLRLLAEVSSHRSRLFGFPSSVLKFFLYCIGKRDIADRMLGSLQVDISKVGKDLDWTPKCSVEDELRRCMQHS